MTKLEIIVKANLAGLKCARNAEVQLSHSCGAGIDFGACSDEKSDSYVAILTRDSGFDLSVTYPCKKHLQDYLTYGWVEI